MNVFRYLIDLIRKSFVRKKTSTITILESWHSQGASVFRYKDSSIPGLVEIWKIDRRLDGIQFFICTINVMNLREDLVLMKTSLNQYVDQQSSANKRILQQIQGQKNVLCTHYWISGIYSEVSGIDPQGRHYKDSKLSNEFVLAGDFQGVAGVYAGDRYVKKFAREIITKLAANEFREYRHHRTWLSAVRSIDWLQWLEGLVRVRINDTHVLQPAIKRRL